MWDVWQPYYFCHKIKIFPLFLKNSVLLDNFSFLWHCRHVFPSYYSLFSNFLWNLSHVYHLLAPVPSPPQYKIKSIPTYEKKKSPYFLLCMVVICHLVYSPPPLRMFFHCMCSQSSVNTCSQIYPFSPQEEIELFFFLFFCLSWLYHILMTPLIRPPKRVAIIIH